MQHPLPGRRFNADQLADVCFCDLGGGNRNTLRSSIHPPLRTQHLLQRPVPLLRPGGCSGVFPRSPAPFPEEKALPLGARGGLAQRGAEGSRGLGSSAKLPGSAGRSEGAGGPVVQVAVPRGVQGHAETLPGRRQLCCSSAAAVLRGENARSLCPDPFQPSLFALQPTVATAPPLPGACLGASQATQQSQTQLPTSAPALGSSPWCGLLGPCWHCCKSQLPAQHLCPALIYFFNEVKSPGVRLVSASPGTALSSSSPNIFPEYLITQSSDGNGLHVKKENDLINFAPFSLTVDFTALFPNYSGCLFSAPICKDA